MLSNILYANSVIFVLVDTAAVNTHGEYIESSHIEIRTKVVHKKKTNNYTCNNNRVVGSVYCFSSIKICAFGMYYIYIYILCVDLCLLFFVV